VLGNVHHLLAPCAWAGPVVLWASFAQWSCWNTLFALAAVC
jgi:hypothetical protein